MFPLVQWHYLPRIDGDLYFTSENWTPPNPLLESDIEEVAIMALSAYGIDGAGSASDFLRLQKREPKARMVTSSQLDRTVAKISGDSSQGLISQ